MNLLVSLPHRIPTTIVSVRLIVLLELCKPPDNVADTCCSNEYRVFTWTLPYEQLNF